MGDVNPTPWVVVEVMSEDRGNSFGVDDARGYPVLTPRNVPRERMQLFAAAPEMLDALQDIVKRNEIQHWFNVDKARAAIAKATGSTS